MKLLPKIIDVIPHYCLENASMRLNAIFNLIINAAKADTYLDKSILLLGKQWLLALKSHSNSHIKRIFIEQALEFQSFIKNHFGKEIAEEFAVLESYPEDALLFSFDDTPESILNFKIEPKNLEFLNN